MLKDSEYLLYFGRLEERKGVQVLGQALPAILRDFPKVKMAFVGEDMGYGQSTMKRWVLDQNNDYAQRLVFIDRQEHEALFPIIRNAKLVILPSPWEGLGYTCQETMALGKVVVATGGSGFGELIHDGENGFLVRPSDSEDLAHTVKHVLRIEDLGPIARKARERAQDFHSTSIATQMVDYYAELSGGR